MDFLILLLYSSLMGLSAPVLRLVLRVRSKGGKEDPARLGERMGVPGRRRPAGRLVWIHAASVGEAQSALILIDALSAQQPDATLLVTTGTVTSAQLMEKRLPSGAFHQYYPLDHPRWTAAFLDHWQPDLVLWMESEIWPNMLMDIARRKIPALLINARLSEKSLRRWKLVARDAQTLLQTFSLVLAQTEEDAASFKALGAENALTFGNIKYAAAPLTADEAVLKALKKAVGQRPLWLYASTHDGEEDIACRLHIALKRKIPDLLTIIVPRHPTRGGDVRTVCRKVNLRYRLRGEQHDLPQAGDDIYIADTLGELGLFYRLAPLTCIGRSFSNDGGGGHNPIEAAQLRCAVLHGPHVQNLAKIYEEMDMAGAALRLKDESDFAARLEHLLQGAGLEALRDKGASFVAGKAHVLPGIINALSPFLSQGKKAGRACA